jgi:hypothetical protein
MTAIMSDTMNRISTSCPLCLHVTGHQEYTISSYVELQLVHTAGNTAYASRRQTCDLWVAALVVSLHAAVHVGTSIV